MVLAEAEEILAEKVEWLWPHLSERQRRLVAAAEARAIGHGGVAAVARASGLSRPTVTKGLLELDEDPLPADRVRRVGAGRKRAVELDPELPAAVECLVDPGARGDPESPLRWTCKSTRQLAAALTEDGHPISHARVADLLLALGYSLQANATVVEGAQHPDRDAQFRHINEQVRRQLRRREPVVSVDTKKKELVGNDKNPGRHWRPAGSPAGVRTHDFIDKEAGTAIPYGVFDVARNRGFVAVGVDHDTSAFAVAALRSWWRSEGARAYPTARRLLVCADAGGSNGSRTRPWKVELARLADEAGIAITVCHVPPGTAKWNKIEHRLFAAISTTWRGQPLTSHEVIVGLIGATTTRTGRTVTATVDRRAYPPGLRISDAAMAALVLEPHDFHGEWNYTLRARRGQRVTT